MNVKYLKANKEDIQILVDTRVNVLRVANKLEENVDLSHIYSSSLEYYQKYLETEEHIAYLVMDDEKCIGTGGISFYRVMPTCDNPTGWKAYIMNMFTDPLYRRRGIAKNLLDLLIAEANKRNISFITLEATEMGRFLYEKYGFKNMESEMELASMRESIS